MKREELELERACRAYARAKGWAAWKNEKNGCKGIPDDSFLHPCGAFLLIEFKRDHTQKPRPEQIKWLDFFSSVAFLVADFDTFKGLIDSRTPSK